MSLEEMLEQLAPRMLAWATRWKMGIYQSIWQDKLISKKMTVPIWKIWDHDQTDKPVQKVDKIKIKETRQKTYKATRITTKLKVTKSWKSISRVSEYIKGNTYLQATFDDLDTVVMEKNDAL